MSANAQEVILASDALTTKQEDFCRAYVETRNASTAYRQVYDVGANTKAATVYRNATALMQHEDVAARIEELRDAIGMQTVVRAREVLADWFDIMGADPNKVSYTRAVNCDRCRGIDHQKQWREIDWAIAAARASDAGEPIPSEHGGFGYDPTLPPVPTCPGCYGAGVLVTYVNNTDELDPQTRKAFAGIKRKSDGSIEVLMHSPLKAREEIAKLLGLYADGKGRGIDLTAPPVELSKDASVEDSATAYLDMCR